MDEADATGNCAHKEELPAILHAAVMHSNASNKNHGDLSTL
jgi:hypothetical protein